MEHENDLKEALDFLSPSSLTYEEWVAVGMALKDGGVPVTVWEQWSTRDAGRYHKGECIKKWESFHGGGGSPVTVSIQAEGRRFESVNAHKILDKTLLSESSRKQGRLAQLV